MKFKKDQQNRNLWIFIEPYCTILALLNAVVGLCDIVSRREIWLNRISELLQGWNR